MIKSALKTIKTVMRNYCFSLLKADVHDKQTQKWVRGLDLKLLYGIIFFIALERVYFWCSDRTLTALMNPEPLIRSEQFTLSLLIHYPQFLLWGIIAGLLALFVLNSIVRFWFGLAEFLYRRIEQTASETSDTVTSEVPHD